MIGQFLTLQPHSLLLLFIVDHAIHAHINISNFDIQNWSQWSG